MNTNRQIVRDFQMIGSKKTMPPKAPKVSKSKPLASYSVELQNMIDNDPISTQLLSCSSEKKVPTRQVIWTWSESTTKIWFRTMYDGHFSTLHVVVHPRQGLQFESMDAAMVMAVGGVFPIWSLDRFHCSWTDGSIVTLPLDAAEIWKRLASWFIKKKTEPKRTPLPITFHVVETSIETRWRLFVYRGTEKEFWQMQEIDVPDVSTPSWAGSIPLSDARFFFSMAGRDCKRIIGGIKESSVGRREDIQMQAFYSDPIQLSIQHELVSWNVPAQVQTAAAAAAAAAITSGQNKSEPSIASLLFFKRILAAFDLHDRVWIQLPYLGENKPLLLRWCIPAHPHTMSLRSVHLSIHDILCRKPLQSSQSFPQPLLDMLWCFLFPLDLDRDEMNGASVSIYLMPKQGPYEFESLLDHPSLHPPSMARVAASEPSQPKNRSEPSQPKNRKRTHVVAHF
jgi:hypothetical protein